MVIRAKVVVLSMGRAWAPSVVEMSDKYITPICFPAAAIRRTGVQVREYFECLLQAGKGPAGLVEVTVRKTGEQISQHVQKQAWKTLFEGKPSLDTGIFGPLEDQEIF
ncbi:MAG: hypothetical protein JWM56_1033 [Candidatus Peribacteria bacterium]|nr:hypothetical protein [Candidatus Peribacteria bacterium]